MRMYLRVEADCRCAGVDAGRDHNFEARMNTNQLSCASHEAYSRKTACPNLRQSLKASPSQLHASAPGRHNIWELTLHSAY